VEEVDADGSRRSDDVDERKRERVWVRGRKRERERRKDPQNGNWKATRPAACTGLVSLGRIVLQVNAERRVVRCAGEE